MKRFSVLLIGVASMVGCGGGDGGGGGSPPTITAVTISGDSTVPLAGTLQLTATAQAGGQTINNGVTFQWSSSDQNKATVSSTGVVSGMQRGTADITAQAELNGTATGMSSPAHPALVPNSFSTLTALGQKVIAACAVLDSGGDTIPAHPCGWSVQPTDSGVVTFSPATGASTQITARKNGDANIRATAFPSLFAPNF